VLVKPCVVVVILLFHESFLNDDSEDVGNHTHRDEDITVKIELCCKSVNLYHIVVCVENHVSMHQSE
jgi:hypothetical protein